MQSVVFGQTVFWKSFRRKKGRRFFLAKGGRHLTKLDPASWVSNVVDAAVCHTLSPSYVPLLKVYPEAGGLGTKRKLEFEEGGGGLLLKTELKKVS